MPSPTTALCQHSHANGNRCGSPALRGEQFCFYHHPIPRPARRTIAVAAPAPAFDLPPIEEPEDIKTAICAIMNGLANNTIDIKRANLMLECMDRATSFMEFRPDTQT
jgi:hypothetical protein